jgi:hypothetical protein
MRYLDGSLIGDLNDNFSATTTGSRGIYVTSSVDEENTIYDLIPTPINELPIITKNVVDSALPNIKPLTVADITNNTYLYVHDDGTVKVHVGTSFQLSIRAQQPQTYNVNNGKPEIIQLTSGLTYTWTKDGINVGNSQTLIINNVGFNDAGTYLCEVANDVGPVFSELVILEVLNLRTDPNFFVNLVQNGYGVDGVNSWESVNDAFITRQYADTEDDLLKQPNRFDLVGYNTNMMYPKPQEVQFGVVREREFTQKIINSNAYFTRAKYTYDKTNGVTLALAYQDIDLTDLIPIIKGGLYGVKGIKALFGCYIGNGISNYIPTERNILPENRTKEINYDMNKPRVSFENFKKAGSPLQIQEQAYVLIQEMNNQTVIKTYRLGDQWTKKIDQYRNYGSYLGSVPTDNAANAILYAADDLFSDNKTRYNYGQYISFERLEMERFNKQTTKIRISLVFETNDDRIFDTYKDFTDASDEVFELLSWQQPYFNDTFALNNLVPLWQKQVQYRIRYNTAVSGNPPPERYPGKSVKQVVPTANNPCGFITGVNLVLIPEYASPLININLSNSFV